MEIQSAVILGRAMQRLLHVLGLEDVHTRGFLVPAEILIVGY